MLRIIAIIGLLSLSACGSNEVVNDENNDAAELPMAYFGDTISEDGALNVTDFLESFEGQDSLEVKFAATITEVCQKKGCWMMLDLGDEQFMRVRFRDYAFFVPKDADGKEAVVEGTAKMETTSVAMLKHYAQDAGESQEVIDAITEDEVSYNFEAIGVIIKGYEK